MLKWHLINFLDATQDLYRLTQRKKRMLVSESTWKQRWDIYVKYDDLFFQELRKDLEKQAKHLDEFHKNQVDFFFEALKKEMLLLQHLLEAGETDGFLEKMELIISFVYGLFITLYTYADVPMYRFSLEKKEMSWYLMGYVEEQENKKKLRKEQLA